MSPNRLLSHKKTESETVIDSSSAQPPPISGNLRTVVEAGGRHPAHGPHLETPGGLLAALLPPPHGLGRAGAWADVRS